MYRYSPQHSHSGFTLIELIVGMTIFSVSMTAILALLSSVIDTSLASRHEIVASNLLREQVELIKNNRNSNIRSFVPWDSILLDGSKSGYLTWGVYLVENDYTSWLREYAGGSITKSPIFIKNISSSFSTLTDLEGKYGATRLYTDSLGRYTHTVTSTGTIYASYILVSPLRFDNASSVIEPKTLDGKNQGYILDARVIVDTRSGYKEYDLKTVITDWKK